MKEEFLQTYLKNSIEKELFENYKIKVDITENEYNLDINFLFSMAARKNIKRGFLFVSKVLGKHIPVAPAISILSGMLLAIKYYKQNNKEYTGENEIIKLFKKHEKLDINEKIFNETLEKKDIIELNIEAGNVYRNLVEERISLEERTLFIGFAETATALGNSVYEMFSENAAYIHTTREYINEIASSIDFDEEHSHAREHFIYGDISKFDKVVLVDDEITTGKTALNFIKKIKEQTGISKFAILSLLDWRNPEYIEMFEKFQKENQLTIETVSVVKGVLSVTGEIDEEKIKNSKIDEQKLQTLSQTKNILRKIYLPNNIFSEIRYTSFNSEGGKNLNYYLSETGRFLKDSNSNKHFDTFINNTAEIIKEVINPESSKPSLFLGTGEFMYIPMRVSLEFQDSLYQSSTRSPIFPYTHEKYGVKTAVQFENMYDKKIDNFLYNIKEGFYGTIVVLLERDVEEIELNSLKKVLERLGAIEICLVIFSNKKVLGDRYYVETIN